MGRTEDQKKKKKKPEAERPTSPESSETDSRPGSPVSGNIVQDIEKAIVELRERGKKNSNLDFVKELRKIQDEISDYKGEERRPITAKPPDPKKAPKKTPKKEKEDDASSSSDDDASDAKMKELVNKRLTTCMMLALSFESDEDYPRDFYVKLSESKKFDEIAQPFKKDEIQLLNQLIKERKKKAKKRVDECGGE